MFDTSNDSYDIVHKLISVNSLYFYFAFTLNTILMIPFFTTKTIIMSTWNNSDRLLQLMTERTLNLRQHTGVKTLKTFAFQFKF